MAPAATDLCQMFQRSWTTPARRYNSAEGENDENVDRAVFARARGAGHRRAATAPAPGPGRPACGCPAGFTTAATPLRSAPGRAADRAAADGGRCTAACAGRPRRVGLHRPVRLDLDPLRGAVHARDGEQRRRL